MPGHLRTWHNNLKKPTPLRSIDIGWEGDMNKSSGVERRMSTVGSCAHASQTLHDGVHTHTHTHACSLAVASRKWTKHSTTPGQAGQTSVKTWVRVALHLQHCSCYRKNNSCSRMCSTVAKQAVQLSRFISLLPHSLIYSHKCTLHAVGELSVSQRRQAARPLVSDG